MRPLLLSLAAVAACATTAPAPAPTGAAVRHVALDCARATTALRADTTPIADLGPAALEHTPRIHLADLVDGGELVAIRIDTAAGSRSWIAGDGPMAHDVRVDGVARVSVQALVRAPDGRCRLARADVAVSADDAHSAVVTMVAGEPVVEDRARTYPVRLRELERRIERLKPQVWRARSRVAVDR